MIFSVVRSKFGPIVVGGIIGFIAFVFIFSGVFSPKSTRGRHEGSVAGTVNGDPIHVGEFTRELNRRMEMFKGMGGGKLTDAQLKAFRIRERVFQDLVNRKLMSQQAERMGLLASDEEVRDRIREIPAFQKDGKFDAASYKRVLEANHQTPGGFEKLMREDLSVQQWNTYFRNRAHVSDEEVRREFLATGEKRNVKYVLLTPETGRKGVTVSDAEIDAYLKDSVKAELAKSRFESKKDAEFKGKSFEDVKKEIVRDLIASNKGDEARSLNEKLAGQVLGALTADAGSDAKVNELLKAYGTNVKATGMVNRLNPYLPGIGDAKEVFADAFAAKSPIDPEQGGKAKKYVTGASILVAVLTGRESVDLSKLDAQRDELAGKLAYRKQRELFEAWIQKLEKEASVDRNDSVVSDQDAADSG